jgi:hypothetical protein
VHPLWYIQTFPDGSSGYDIDMFRNGVRAGSEAGSVADRFTEDIIVNHREGCSCPYSRLIILHAVLSQPQISINSLGSLVGQYIKLDSSPRAFICGQRRDYSESKSVRTVVLVTYMPSSTSSSRSFARWVSLLSQFITFVRTQSKIDNLPN